MPAWNAKDAYRLIDRRLRHAAADQAKFKNPIALFSLESLVAKKIVETYSPREWIIHTKRIFENISEDIIKITPIIVSRIFSQVDVSKINQIRHFASSEFPRANKLINTILEVDPKEAIRLLTIVARMYRNDLPRPLTKETSRSVGFDDLPLLVETLKRQKIAKESKRTSPPRKVGRGVVEVLYREVYRLNEDLKEFFEKVEEKFGLDPEEYLLRFVARETEFTGLTEKESIIETELNLERMKAIWERLTIPRAKGHLSSAMEDYSTFIGSAFSSLTINKTMARSGIMVIYNIVGAFIVERTKDPHYSVDIEKDFKVLNKTLKPGERVIQAASSLYDSFKDIEYTGKRISENFSNTAKRQIPQIVRSLLLRFDEWTLRSPEERLLLDVQESIESIKAKVLRDRSTIRKGAINYLKTLASQRKIPIDEKWIDAFLKVLEPKGVDVAIMEAVDIRCNPQLYPLEKNQAYKTALCKVGLIFENVLMLVGRNHTDPRIRRIFTTRKQLTVGYMLSKLFEYNHFIKAMLQCYSSFDRSKETEDFEKKVKELLDGVELGTIPHYARYYALSTLIRNFYSHEGCQDTIANKDESIFQQVFNEGLLSALSVFKYCADHKAFKKSKVKS